nr:transposase [Tuwongella immobilis]
MVNHHEAKRGFVVVPRHWVVEQTFGWLQRFQLARDHERLTESQMERHWLAVLMLLGT